MLRVSPSQKAMLDRISALQMQIQSLSGDPQAIADLTSKLATMQAAADGYPAIQSALSEVQSQVNGISVPDVSGLATKTALSTVENKIPSISGLATTSALTALSDRVNAITVPDVSGLATKSALSTVEAKIPSITGLATNASVSSLSTRIDGLSIPDVSGLASKTALSTVEGKIPAAATVSPPATDLVQQTGTSTKFAREDHTHKARVKRAMITIGADGTAKWDFAEPFTMIPIVTHMVQETAGQNRVNVIITSISTTSVTVYADRMRNLPVMQQLNSGLIGTVSAVVSGVNGLITSLSGYNLLGGPGSANGVKVHLYAAEPIA